MTIDGVTYHVKLWNHSLAEKIAAMCPFEADFARSGNHEYYAALPQKGATHDCESTTSGRKNMLYYFEGWNALSIVIQDCNTAPYRIQAVGDFEEDISSSLAKAGRNIHILCEAV